MKKFIFILAAMLVFPAAAYSAGHTEKTSLVFETLEECALDYSENYVTICSMFSCDYKEAVGGYQWRRICSCDFMGDCKSAAGHKSCADDSSTGCSYPTACNSGYYRNTDKMVVGITFEAPACTECPANATCDGSSTITCDLGYTETDGECVIKKAFNDNDVLFACMAGYTDVNGECVKDGAANTVNSCPPEMTLSADGCCCLN